MKQIEYFGKIYDIKEDDEFIGINTFYQVFTRSYIGEYKFFECRNDLVGKVNILPQTLSINECNFVKNKNNNFIIDESPWRE